VGPIEEQLRPVTLAYLPSLEGVDLRLTAWNVTAEDGEALLAGAAGMLGGVLGATVYGEGDRDLAAVVLDRLHERGARLAVAESCTGGLVGARITAVPGSSAVFVGGVITYDDAVKTRELEVPAAVLAAHGAVSEPVVRAMVDGVRARFGVETGIAVSGIAGPGGGTAEKPVGTIWLAAAHGELVRTVRLRLPGDRGEIRARAAQAVLDLLRRLLAGPDGGRGGLH
jgi:nicotinamide-nucleotide amidase